VQTAVLVGICASYRISAPWVPRHGHVLISPTGRKRWCRIHTRRLSKERTYLALTGITPSPPASMAYPAAVGRE
jgi:hypothetical protein